MCRKGYYAFANEPLDDSHRPAAINAAARSPLDATGIGFTVNVDRPATQSAVRQLALDVDARAVTLEPSLDTWVGALDVVFAQLDGKGSIVTSIGRQVPIRLSADQRRQLLEQGLVLNAPVEIKPECTKLRVVIRDAKSGAVGTVTIPMT